MIDIENEVFDRLKKAVLKKFPKAFITSEYVAAPPRFPCVAMEEIDNSMYQPTQTSCEAENHAYVAYEINIFANNVNGRKSEAKAIRDTIDIEMSRMGFNRSFFRPIPNMADATIYRLTGRYSAVISKDKILYRR